MLSTIFIWVVLKFISSSLSYWLHLLLIVCGDIESNSDLCSDKRVRVLYFNIRGFMPNWTSWLWLDLIMMFWFVLSLMSLIAAISQSSVSLALVAHNRRTPLLVPSVWLFMLGKDSAPSSRASWNVLAMNPACFVFSIG